MKRGYTLIEILVGITIISLLFALGYINFRDFSRRQAIAGAAKLLQGNLRLAQQLALSGQKPNDPNCNDPNFLNGYRFSIAPPNEYLLRADCSLGPAAVLKDIFLPSDISISVSPAIPNPIIFKVLGQGTNIPAGTSMVIKLTQANTSNTVSITVDAGGGVQ